MSTLRDIEATARVRWLLLGSLALNLFFVGAAGAVAFRYSSPVPLATIARIDRDAASRLDRIAATLPSGDAKVMRAEFRADAVKVATAQADLRLSQEMVRNSLRAEPFDIDAMRAAMAESRAARENFDLVLHDVIVSAAAKMSVVGRNKLADWPSKRQALRVQ
jgi:uncharacterized membrane protein